MGILDKLKGKTEEEMIEVEPEEEEKKQITIRIEHLGGFGDVERISRLIKEGNIVFLNTKELQKKDLGEFQNAIKKLQRICGQFNWDIAGTEEGYIVITPNFGKIIR
ncbi:MAG: cell division protein SepF [Candidatus Aenigmatarchaeota archaeon]